MGGVCVTVLFCLFVEEGGRERGGGVREGGGEEEEDEGRVWFFKEGGRKRHAFLICQKPCVIPLDTKKPAQGGT